MFRNAGQNTQNVDQRETQGEQMHGNSFQVCSKSSLSLRDVDLNTVGALSCRVLSERGGTLRLQQPSPRLCPLPVPEVKGLLPDG